MAAFGSHPLTALLPPSRCSGRAFVLLALAAGVCLCAQAGVAGASSLRGKGLLQAPEGSPSTEQARGADLSGLGIEALVAAGKASHDQEDFPGAIQAYSRAVDLLRRQGGGPPLGSCLHNLARAYRETGNYEAAEAAFLAAGDELTAEGDHPAAAHTWYALALDVYWRIGRAEDAVRLYRRALKVWEVTGDRVYEARALNNIGIVFFNWAVYEEALAYYNRSLAIRRVIADSAGVALVLNNVGQIYQRWGSLDRALTAYTEAHSFARPFRGSNALAYTFFNLASVHGLRKEYRAALSFYDRAAQEYGVADNPGGIIETLIGKGAVYEEMGRTGDALRILTAALERARSGRHPIMEAKALQRLGSFHARGGRHGEALDFFRQSLSASQRLNKRDLLLETYRQASSSYEALGRHAEALHVYKLFAATEDSIYGGRNEQVMRELKAKHEASIRTEEIARLQRTTRQRNATILLVSLCLALVVLLALWLFRANRHKHAANRLLAESNAQILRERDQQRALLQILCHDLANPIASAHGLLDAMLEDQSTIPEFGPIAHRVIGQGLDMINLVREMQMLDQGSLDVGPVALRSAVDSAVVVLQGRLEEKALSLLVDVDPELTVWAERRSLSNSVIANLLTNAIKFSPDGSRVEVRATRADGMVWLAVRDYGIGMPDQVREHLFETRKNSTRQGTRGERGSGFGLPLVKRFVDLYGGRLEVVSTEASVDPVLHGTEVRIAFRGAEVSLNGTEPGNALIAAPGAESREPAERV